MKIKIKNVTLVAVAGTKIPDTLEALEYSLKKCEFSKILFFSHKKILIKNPKIKFIKIKKLTSIKNWSEFIIFELYKFIKTSHILLIHWDGFVINPDSWNKKYLQYDYIGAPFPIFKGSFLFKNINRIIMGNSVSLRSKKLLELPTKLGLKWKEAVKSNFHEDGYLCEQQKKLLVKNGVKFSPIKIAYNFSREYTFLHLEKSHPFVFHKWFGFNKNFERLKNPINFKEKLKRFIRFGIYE
jgi:hypothetical protein